MKWTKPLTAAESAKEQRWWTVCALAGLIFTSLEASQLQMMLIGNIINTNPKMRLSHLRDFTSKNIQYNVSRNKALKKKRNKKRYIFRKIIPWRLVD